MVDVHVLPIFGFMKLKDRKERQLSPLVAKKRHIVCRERKKKCYYAEIIVLTVILEVLLSNGFQNVVLMVISGIFLVERNLRRKG